MAVTEDGSPEVKIKQEEVKQEEVKQEEVNGDVKGPIPRRKKPSSSSTRPHVTNILAKYLFSSMVLSLC
jgi:hypothetical protein